MSETQACNVAPCAIDCAVSDWDDWGECSATCRTGTRCQAFLFSVWLVSVNDTFAAEGSFPANQCFQ